MCYRISKCREHVGRILIISHWVERLYNCFFLATWTKEVENSLDHPLVFIADTFNDLKVEKKLKNIFNLGEPHMEVFRVYTGICAQGTQSSSRSCTGIYCMQVKCLNLCTISLSWKMKMPHFRQYTAQTFQIVMCYCHACVSQCALYLDLGKLTSKHIWYPLSDHFSE